MESYFFPGAFTKLANPGMSQTPLFGGGFAPGYRFGQAKPMQAMRAHPLVAPLHQPVTQAPMVAPTLGHHVDVRVK
jgi:hypothetical protein